MFREALKKWIPVAVQRRLLALRDGWRRLRNRRRYSGGDQACPVCGGESLTFLPFGDPPRPGAQCPLCSSLERHRLDWLFFRERTDLFDGAAKRMLHIAPEPFLERRFARLSRLEYLSADLMDPRAMERMDITDIQYPEASFDVIYCSHVLEHVPDDRRAMAEFHRVCRPGGWALLQVPITVEETLEDPSVTSPEARKELFGQRDHVRRCGPDYVERMREAGFDAETVTATDLLSDAECRRLGIQQGRLLFFCRKTAT